MRNLNHWMTYMREVLAEWYVEVPAPAANIDTLLRLAERIVAAGEQERVFRLLRAPTQPPFLAASGVTYGSHLARLVEQTSALCLFAPHAPPGREGWLAPAQLAFFAPDGSVAESEIDDLGALLRRLRPESMEYASSFMILPRFRRQFPWLNIVPHRRSLLHPSPFSGETGRRAGSSVTAKWISRVRQS